MSNTLITPSVIAKEALFQLENNLVMGNLVHKDYKKEFVKVGATVSIRKPVQFVASDGATRVNQSVSESTTSITVNKQKHVSWGFSSQDLTLTIDQYSERYIKPAMIALANQVDYDLCGLYVDIANAVGTAGTAPSSFATTAGLVGKRMDQLAVPQDGRKLVLDPAARWGVLGGIQGTSTGPWSTKIAENAFERAKVGLIGGFEMFGDQNVRVHTRGSHTTTTTYINGSNQTGASLTCVSTDGLTFKKGDVVTCVGCYDVNPKSKATLSHLKQFTITADATAASSAVTLSIDPPIITSGAYQNCSASPTTGSSGYVEGIYSTGTTASNHTANLGFIKNTFALVMVPMELPDGAPFKARETYNNLSVRVIKQYDIDEDTDIIRLDIMYGLKTIYPETGVRLMG